MQQLLLGKSSPVRGIFFVSILSLFAIYLSQQTWFASLGVSPLIIGIGTGLFIGNAINPLVFKRMQPGFIYSTKTILRLGIVLYGFRLTLQNIGEVGVAGIIVSLFIVISTFFIGYFAGYKCLKLDRDTTILISAGSSICGAAAVLATEPVLKSEHYKTSIAIATVVVFGTISMFIYPFLYQSGIFELSPHLMGIYLGGSLHEVAHVVAAGNAINDNTAHAAVIVKMQRVMLLAPFLIVLSLWVTNKLQATSQGKVKHKVIIPWFAIAFIGVVVFNSIALLPAQTVNQINQFDTLLLTMAMTALGLETHQSKFKNVGLKPLYLAVILFAWLLFGGYLIIKSVSYIN